MNSTLGKSVAKPKKSIPAGPGLSVTAFVDLMRRLEVTSPSLSGEQVRFIQLCLQRFESESLGIVKTSLSFRRTKKDQQRRVPQLSVAHLQVQPTDAKGDEFLNQLTRVATEELIAKAIDALSGEQAQKLATAQGLRSKSGDQAKSS
jgi:hypothetical protein